MSEDLLIACQKASRNLEIDVIKLIDNIIAELKKEQVVDESKQEGCKAQVDQAEDNDTDGSGVIDSKDLKVAKRHLAYEKNVENPSNPSKKTRLPGPPTLPGTLPVSRVSL